MQTASQAAKSTKQPSSPQPTHDSGMQRPLVEHTVSRQQSASVLHAPPQQVGALHCTSLQIWPPPPVHEEASTKAATIESRRIAGECRISDGSTIALRMRLGAARAGTG